MSSNRGNRGNRTCAWRAWCHGCLRHLTMAGHRSLWPDEIQCPACLRWCKVIARGTAHLAGDVICAPGSGRCRVQDR